jgi:hypothetical protein
MLGALDPRLGRLDYRPSHIPVLEAGGRPQQTQAAYPSLRPRQTHSPGPQHQGSSTTRDCRSHLDRFLLAPSSQRVPLDNEGPNTFPAPRCAPSPRRRRIPRAHHPVPPSSRRLRRRFSLRPAENGISGDIIMHGTTSHPYISPKLVLIRRVQHLWQHGAIGTTPLYTFFDAAGTSRHITDRMLTTTLRMGAALLLGIEADATVGTPLWLWKVIFLSLYQAPRPLAL